MESSTGMPGRSASVSSGTDETGVVHDRGMETPGERPELLEYVVELVRRLGEELLHAGSPAARRPARRSVSASPTSRCCAPSWRLRSTRRRLAVPGLQDAGPRRLLVAQLGPELRHEALVVDRRGRGDAAARSRTGSSRSAGSWIERGDPVAVTSEGGDGAGAVRRRLRRRQAEPVDPAPRGGAPVHELERRIVEHAPEGVDRRRAGPIGPRSMGSTA